MTNLKKHLLMLAMVVGTGMATANEPINTLDKAQKIKDLTLSQDSTKPILDQKSTDHYEKGQDLYTHPFFDLLNLTSISEVPMDIDEIVERSDVIAIGTIDSVSQGRVLDFKKGGSHPMKMAAIKFNITKAIKGKVKVKDYVFVEYLVDGIPIELLNESIFDQKVFVFLTKDDRWDLDTYTVEYPDKELEQSEALYSLTSQKGLLIMREQGTYQPLEAEPAKFFLADSFEELTSKLKLK